jgi:DNA-binding protein YbaB
MLQDLIAAIKEAVREFRRLRRNRQRATQYNLPF